jgi:hypothetical protein
LERHVFLPTGVNDAKVAVSNLYGQKVQEIMINSENSSLQVDLSSLSPGIYYYSLVTSEGFYVKTKKLIISR